MKQSRTKFLSMRMNPGMFMVLEAEAADAGMTKSRFARNHLARVLKERQYRRHVLGLDRPKASQPYIGNQCPTPPA